MVTYVLRLRGAGGQRGGAPQLVLRPRAKIDMGTDSPDALHNMTGRNMKRRGKETGYSEKDISFFWGPKFKFDGSRVGALLGRRQSCLNRGAWGSLKRDLSLREH